MWMNGRPGSSGLSSLQAGGTPRVHAHVRLHHGQPHPALLTRSARQPAPAARGLADLTFPRRASGPLSYAARFWNRTLSTILFCRSL